MKNLILVISFLVVNTLSAQIVLEMCSKGSNNFELFQVDDKDELLCSDDGHSVIITLDGNNEKVWNILATAEGETLGKEKIEKTIRMTKIFSTEDISVLKIESIDSLKTYRLLCDFNGKEGYLLYSILNKED